MPQTLSWLHTLEEIARDAGAAIMDIYAEEIRVRQKDDLSPVTDADEAAERIILAGLATLDPETPVVAEESMMAGKGPGEAPGARFWLVDPLDGTKEFIRRQGEFTVNIALIERGRPVMGVVYAPAIGALYLGAAGHGAWRILDRAPGKREVITVREGDPANLVAVASKSHRTPGTNAFLDRLPIGESRAAGSSLKFCLVAEGSADVYPRIGPTMEWDTAAGHAVLGAAGGRVVTLDGAEMSYGKPGFRNPDYYAYGIWPKGLPKPEMA